MNMRGHYEVSKNEFLLSTDPSKLDPGFIHQYLSKESYWAQGIPMDVVRRAISNSLCFGLYEGAIQIGFARVVTDKATFAYLADVFIIDSFRGRGLSKWMMGFIQAHPELQGLRRWMLGTRDAHGLYEQFGWKALDDETSKRFMQRHFKDVYRAGRN